MRDIIRSNEVEIKKIFAHQVIIRGSGDSKFNNLLNKKLKLLPPLDNLRIVSDDSHILAKLSFDQWNLIFLNKNEEQALKLSGVLRTILGLPVVPLLLISTPLVSISL